MTGNTAHFLHAFFMKFFSGFQWENISSDDIIVDAVQDDDGKTVEVTPVNSDSHPANCSKH